MTLKPITICELELPLGRMVAGATTTGICYLTWPDDKGLPMIEKKLRKQYNIPVDSADNMHLILLKEELKAYFSGKLTRFKTPLDMIGTQFQQQVWAQLLKIPYNETRSYGDVAKSIGNPKAVRAVGGANGANPVVIIVPCHRVIAANGTLHGYGGQLWRKKALLDLEGGLGFIPETD